MRCPKAITSDQRERGDIIMKCFGRMRLPQFARNRSRLRQSHVRFRLHPVCRMRGGAGLIADCLTVSVVVFLSSAADLVVLIVISSVGDVSGWELRKIVCDVLQSPKKKFL